MAFYIKGGAILKKISIDIETYSSVDLTKCGVYPYVESCDFQILLFAYSIDDSDVKVVDVAKGENIPSEVLHALCDDKVVKWAFNANFERICLSKYMGKYLCSKGWHCTMVWCATLGLPLSLEVVGKVMGLEKQKLAQGKSLIKYFCAPCSPTKSNGGRTRNLPIHDEEKWEIFKEYNKRDVETEMMIQNRLSRFPVSNKEWENYWLDQLINDRGIMLDMDFVKKAIACDKEYKEGIVKKARRLTKLENPNSVSQLKNWLQDKGINVASLNKASVEKLLEENEGIVSEVLLLRKELAKSSVKKYSAMENVVGSDNRARGLIQFYGAARTGRYAGRLIQVQNLPQNHLKDLELARSLVRSEDYETLDLLYDSVENVLSQLIRTSFVPRKGHKFIVADFSAIEARVIAWLADEAWRLQVFEEGGDIYSASASKMFKVVVEKGGKNSYLREKGKIAELALGYGGSVGALKSMGAMKMGIEEDELQYLVNSWRNSNSNIVKLWWEIDRAVKNVIATKDPITVYGLSIFYESGMLFIKLPSGRKLSYVKPVLAENKFGGTSVTYEGVDSSKKWSRIESYGPKFVENIVQGIARDLLAESMDRLEKAGLDIVMHVHDEVVIEVEEGKSSVEEVCEIMGVRPPWAKGMVLRAEGYECGFYRKG